MSNRRALAKATKESREPKPVAKPKDIIYDPAGQWKFPGQATRIPSNEITMDSVNYPVWAVPDVGQPTMMQPGSYHTFPGAKYVDEYPQMAEGGMVEPMMDENGEPRCPDGYTYNPKNGYCEKSNVGCPEGFEVDPETGKCIERECKPGYVKNQVGNCVPDINTLKEIYPIERHSEWETDKGETGKIEIRAQEFVDKASQTCPPNHFYDEYQGKCVKYYTKEEVAGWTKFPEELFSHKNYNDYLKALKDQWINVQGGYWDPISNKHITAYVPGENFEDSRLSIRIPKAPEKILTEQVARTERLIPEYEQPKLELKENKLPGFKYMGPEEDRKLIKYINPTLFKKGIDRNTINWAPYSAALRMFTGYNKGESEKELKEEIKAANEEGRPINFKSIPLMGKSDLKYRRAYKNAMNDYTEREKKLEEENQKRENEYNKAMIDYTNQMLEEEAKRKASGLQIDKYGGSTLEYKRGGVNARSFSRNLQATNKFFAESKLFKKPKKLSKKRIYDPNAKYYQDGGMSYSNLPITYQEALQNFVYPNAIDDPENAGYNSINNTISYDSQSPIENMSNDWWREHEVFHDLQNQAGGMSTLGVVGQRPNPYVASDESLQGYYNRRDADVNRTIDSMIAQDPNLQFIPREKLAQSNFDEETGEPIFVGAEDLQYSDPSTLEGEARQYEQYIREGNPSIFPKKQNGGTNRTKLTKEEENQFKNFYSTLPENLQTDDDTYDIRGYWDALGRPEEFDYNQPTESDGYYHAFSINPNTGEYLKSPAHPTFQHAIDEDRKIGYRPITNVYGRNIATEVPFIADPEETNPFAYNAGPANYIDIELDEDEIDQYVKGGYIVEDISVPSLNTYQRGGSPCGRGKYMNEKGECVSLDWNTVDLASDYDIGSQWTNNRSWENQNGKHIANLNAIKVNAPAKSKKLSDWILRGGRTKMQEMQDFGKKYSSEFGLGYNEPLIAANTTKEGVKKFKKYVKDAIDAQNKYYKKQTKILKAEEEKRQEYEKARKKVQSGKMSTSTFASEYKEKGWSKYDPNVMNEAYKGQFQEAVNEANKRKEANMGVTNTALELLGGGAYRVVADPIGTAEGVAKTVADVATLPQGLVKGAVNYTNTGNFDMGTNVLTGENYGGGLDQTFDVLGAIPGIAAIGKLAKFTKAANLASDISKGVKSTSQSANKINSLGTSNIKEVNKDIEGLFKSNPELASIGTPEEYTTYLNTIFPESAIKDIMFHQTFAKDFDTFKNSNLGATYLSFFNVPTGGAFAPLFKKMGSRTLLTKVNVNNPFIVNRHNYPKIKKATGLATQDVEKLKKKFDLSKHDAVLGYPNPRLDKGELDQFPNINFIKGRRGDLIELGVMDPKNTHILGSKPDIEGFKQFVKKQNPVSNALKQFFNRPPGPMMLLGPTGTGSNMIKKNLNYYKQLLDSYDAKKMSAANRKFYNDLIESGRKQGDMLTETQLRELDRLKNSNFDFGKRGYAKGGITNNYIEMDIPQDKVQWYIDNGYDVEILD